MAGKKRIKSQARIYSKGRQEKTQRQARQDSKTGKTRLKGRQDKTQRQTRQDSRAGKKSL